MTRTRIRSLNQNPRSWISHFHEQANEIPQTPPQAKRVEEQLVVVIVADVVDVVEVTEVMTKVRFT